MMKYGICAFPRILGSPSSYMTLQLLHWISLYIMKIWFSFLSVFRIPCVYYEILGDNINSPILAHSYCWPCATEIVFSVCCSTLPGLGQGYWNLKLFPENLNLFPLSEISILKGAQAWDIRLRVFTQIRTIWVGENPKLGWFRPENRQFVLFSDVGYNSKKL
jgi:hypothetical protein